MGFFLSEREELKGHMLSLDQTMNESRREFLEAIINIFLSYNYFSNPKLKYETLSP